MMHFESVTPLDEADRSVIYQWLRDHNVATNSPFVEAMESGASKPLTITARDHTGTIIGGLIGETLIEWLRVHVIAISPGNRRGGVGTRLLAEAEEEAKARGCTSSYIDTMSYQSPDFYRRLGYSVIGEIPNWDSHGHTKYFFTKRL